VYCDGNLSPAIHNTVTHVPRDVCGRHRFEADHNCSGVVEKVADKDRELRRKAFLEAYDARATAATTAPAPVAIPVPTGPVAAPALNERCPQCGMRFPSVIELIAHAESAHPAPRSAPASVPAPAPVPRPAGGREACPQCDARFDDVTMLIAHVESAHGSASRSSGGRPSEDKNCVVS
jgi:uncharacterized C2H2 Zn-finger protein